MPLALVTPLSRKCFDALTEKHPELRYCASAVVTGDDVASGGDLVTKAAQRLGVSIGRCLVFASTEARVRAATAAGAFVAATPDDRLPSNKAAVEALEPSFLLSGGGVGGFDPC